MNTQNKNENNKNSQSDVTDWRIKLNDIVNTCQSELKKTTKIGMKMLSASQANSQLHESYEFLGKWLYSSLKSGKLKVEDEEVLNMIKKIATLEEDLNGLEKDVQNIKKE